MGTTQQRANVQHAQQKYTLPGAAFDGAQFDALQRARAAKGHPSMVTDAAAMALPAATVFAGMSVKLTDWRFAQDSWRTDDEVL